MLLYMLVFPGDALAGETASILVSWRILKSATSFPTIGRCKTGGFLIFRSTEQLGTRCGGVGFSHGRRTRFTKRTTDVQMPLRYH